MVCPAPSNLPANGVAPLAPTGMKLPPFHTSRVLLAVVAAAISLASTYWALKLMPINCNWCAELIVFDHSEASIGKVAPVPVVLLKLPSVLTITQLLPVAPALVVKLKPVKLEALFICVLLRPVVVPVPVLSPIADPALSVVL